MALAAGHVGSIRVPATGTREPAFHRCSSAVLARRQIMIRLQLRNQPPPFLFGELANLVQNFLTSVLGSAHEGGAYPSGLGARKTPIALLPADPLMKWYGFQANGTTHGTTGGF